MFAARNTLFARTAVDGLTSFSFSPSGTTKPPGIVDVLMTAGAGASIVTSSTFVEGTSSNSNGGYNSALVMPEQMASSIFSVTVTVGALGTAANNRAVGPGIFSADGTVGVFARLASLSSTATLNTWSGGTETARSTLGSQRANTGDTITLTVEVSGGVATWTVTKNGSALGSGLSWTDSSHLIDLPGNHPAIAFRHQYSASHFISRGVTTISAAV